MNWIRRHTESLLVALLGLLVMAGLNGMMTQWHWKLWTHPKVGFWTAFHKHFVLSGFDENTYITISKWRPLYELFRHPLLSGMMWPFSELNEYLKDEYSMNCAIVIVAVVWTIVSTATWMLMYRVLRDVVRLTVGVSMLLTLLFFGFSHVMLATFAPDHMILSCAMLLLTLYVASSARQEERSPALWKVMLMYFVSMGITTTNCVKVWLSDMMACYDTRRRVWENVRRLFCRSLVYLVPTLVIGGLYLWQLDTTEAEETAFQAQATQKRIEKDSVFAQQYQQNLKQAKAEESHQTSDSKYFQWTDNRVGRLPLLYENIFGEGLLLHEDHLLQDANRGTNPRPVFVSYRHWWQYGVGAVVFVLFAIGLWSGRRERLMQMAFGMFLFDMFLHVGMRFAATDVYIMTAHWAFVIPIAIGYLLKALDSRVALGVIGMLVVLTSYMWWHNASLIVKYILNL